MNRYREDELADTDVKAYLPRYGSRYPAIRAVAVMMPTK